MWVWTRYRRARQPYVRIRGWRLPQRLRSVLRATALGLLDIAKALDLLLDSGLDLLDVEAPSLQAQQLQLQLQQLQQQQLALQQQQQQMQQPMQTPHIYI